MKEQITLEGRSLVLNIVMVLLNLTGLAFLVIGYHDSFAESATLFKFLGLILMIASAGGIVMFRGRYMMSSVARVLVGGLFIVSGLVKANDPIGFSYKLEEYFEDGALAFRIKEWFGAPGFSMEFFIDYALLLSVIICIAEIILGVLTIIGGKIKLVSYLMLVMMLFFTFLTWHTANCDKDMKFVDHDTYAMSDPVAALKIEEAKVSEDVKILSQTNSHLVVEELKSPQCVSDCGCFGDAMKGSVGRSLTPKESLWKDIVLLYLVIWIFLAQWIIKPNTRKQNMVYTVTSMLVIVFFSWVFGWYFPIFFGLVGIIGALWMLRVGGRFLGNHYGSSLFVTIICGLLVGYVLLYLPIKDYRPYAIGSNLVEKMNDGVVEINEDLLVYRNAKTNETREYGPTSTEYTESKIWEDQDWVYDTMIKKVIVAGKLASIDSSQFNPFIAFNDVTEHEMKLDAIRNQVTKAKVKGLKLWDVSAETNIELPMAEYNTTDYSPESYTILDTIEMIDPYVMDVSLLEVILSSDRMVLVTSKNLNEGDWRNVERLKSIFKSCEEQGVPFAVICGASREEMNAFRDKHKFFAPFFANDGTELKAISRSNPTLMVIEKGVVKAKYPFRSTPTKDSFKTKHLN